MWHTFQGGSENDHPMDIAVDASGNSFITGYSYGDWGSPARAFNADDRNRNGFVVKLDTNGARQWNTFQGGSGVSSGSGVAVDGSGNVYATGRSDASWGTPVNAYSADLEAYIVKLDDSSGGALTWNSFVGGGDLGSNDAGNSIDVDSSGNIYVAGVSPAPWGAPVRAYTAGQDAWVAKLNSSGSLLWHTFLGGSGNDAAYGIDEASTIVYIVGTSDATWDDAGGYCPPHLPIYSPQRRFRCLCCEDRRRRRHYV